MKGLQVMWYISREENMNECVFLLMMIFLLHSDLNNVNNKIFPHVNQKVFEIQM